MKPKTKRQHLVVSLSEKLPAVQQKHIDWAYKNNFKHIAVRTKSGEITCMDCGHGWKTNGPMAWHDEITEDKCPSCNTKISVTNTMNRVWATRNFFTICTVSKGFQVVRNFEVKAYYKKRQPVEITCWEINQLFIDEKGNHEVISRLSKYYTDTFQGSLELRQPDKLIKFSIKNQYPKYRVIDMAKRNGFKGDFHSVNAFDFVKGILSCSYTETLLKANQISLFDEIRDHYFRAKLIRRWDSVKICMRNNYIVKDATVWIDYINMLDYFGKDLLNKKYVCPVDLFSQHEKYLKKKQDAERKRAIAKLQQEAAYDNKKYARNYKKYFKLTFILGNITVEVMKSVQQVMIESQELKHCAFQSGYHRRDNSLLLSARVDGKVTETVQFCTKTKRIIQCRGLSNGESPYHKKIVQLVEKHKNDIHKITLGKTKSKPKPKQLITI